MIPIGNKIIFTDGNYDSPYVREIVEALTEYQTKFEAIRECIYNVEKGKSSKQDEVQTFKKVYGDGIVITYRAGISGVYGWEDGKRKGKTRRAVIANYLNKQVRAGNDIKSRETPINEIAPVKEASSEDGVFFDGNEDTYTSKKAPMLLKQLVENKTHCFVYNKKALPCFHIVKKIKIPFKNDGIFLFTLNIKFQTKTLTLQNDNPINCTVHELFFSSISFKCCFKTIFIYCERERSSFSALSFSFIRTSLSIVILIFSFKGFILSPHKYYKIKYLKILTSRIK